ncbi:hypothetical protein PoB_000413100 [Plakobranchus ocellatus]|uniref:Uncharacterized protein n=1 Tax=Plakobranchus ocellatus TaxID=259542 RepID=A0AAV3Y363_9GAST|nr:hypothetical protein PoB_000413100 [Plakobranchus ocellatus]
MASHKSFNSNHRTKVKNERSREEYKYLPNTNTSLPGLVSSHRQGEGTLCKTCTYAATAQQRTEPTSRIIWPSSVCGLPAKQNAAYAKGPYLKPRTKPSHNYSTRQESVARERDCLYLRKFTRELSFCDAEMGEFFPGTNTPETSRAGRARQDVYTGTSVKNWGTRYVEQGMYPVPRHNMTILPASCLMFQGQRLYQRPASPPSSDIRMYRRAKTTQRQAEQIVEISDYPQRVVRRMYKEKPRVFQEKQRRKKSAVILPKIRYEDEESSDGDEAQEEETFECEENELTDLKEKEKRGRSRDKLFSRKTRLDRNQKVHDAGSNFNVEKIRMQPIPVAQVKDLTGSQSQKPWREVKERRSYKHSRQDAAKTYSPPFPSFVTADKPKEDELKYRMPHLDDNVRTMMNSTPFWGKRNVFALKPPEPLESIRVQRANKLMLGNQEMTFHEEIVSVSTETEGKSMATSVSLHCFSDYPHRKCSQKFNNTELTHHPPVKQHLLNKNVQAITPNTFVRNSSDFCTPFCSEFDDVSFQISNCKVSQAFVDTERLETTETPSASSFSDDAVSGDIEEPSEMAYYDSGLQGGRCAGNSDKDYINDSRDPTESVDKNQEDFLEGKFISTDFRSTQPRCSSPDYAVGSIVSTIDKTTFPKCLERDIPTLDLIKKNKLISQKESINNRRPNNAIRSCEDDIAGPGEVDKSRENKLAQFQREKSTNGDPNYPQKCDARLFQAKTLQGDHRRSSSLTKRNDSVKNNHVEHSQLPTSDERYRANPEMVNTNEQKVIDLQGKSNLISCGENTDLSSGYASSFEMRSLSVHQTEDVNNPHSRQVNNPRVKTWLNSEAYLHHSEEESNCTFQPSTDQTLDIGENTFQSSRHLEPTEILFCGGFDHSPRSPAVSRLQTCFTMETSLNTSHPAPVIDDITTSQQRKPPLCRQRRYENFRSNPNFITFRSSTFDSTDCHENFLSRTETSALFLNRCTSDLVKPGSRGSLMSLTPFGPAREPDSDYSPDTPGALSDHLVRNLSDLQKLRGYGGIDIANRGIKDFTQDMYTHNHGCRCDIHFHNPKSSNGHFSYNDYQNQNRYRVRSISDLRLKHGTKSHRKNEIKFGSRNPYILHTTCHPENVESYLKNSHETSCPTATSQPHSEQKTDSRSHRAGTPNLIHHPSCREFKKQKHQTQQKRQDEKSRSGHARKVADYVKSRTAFNNLRQIHQRRLGAFSKFLFSRICVSLYTERENLDPSGVSQDPIYENRAVSVADRFPRPVQTGSSVSRSEGNPVKHHSVIASLMTPHQLTVTSQAQSESSSATGVEIQLQGTPCHLQTAPVRNLPPPIDYPDLRLRQMEYVR